jgi:hypothetical protein
MQRSFAFLDGAPRPDAARGEADKTPADPPADPPADLPADPPADPPAGASREALSAALESALLRELRKAFDWENWARFGGRLKPPVIALSDAATRLGCWIRDARMLELSRAMVCERPWPLVIGVLQHEMAHQFVDEVLAIHDQTAHGETFRRVCAERGIDMRAAGPPAPAAGQAESDRTLDRIRKLLALAGSPNLNEAEAAMRRAHELMLRHNIEAVGGPARRGFEVRHLGDPLRRATRVQSDVVGLVSRFFFVEVIRIPVYLPHHGRRGFVYEVVGTRANVEMACHVYAFLLATAERLWSENRGDARVRSGRDRLAYQSGVVRGFHEKLAGERKELGGTGLVWVGDADLDEFFRARHPRVATRHRQVRMGGAHAAGREAGRAIVLHRPIEQGPSSRSTRLLGR